MTPPQIKLGSKGSAVSKWQEILGATVDGSFGPETRRLTQQWQSSRYDDTGARLKVDGIVGPLTWGTALRDENPVGHPSGSSGRPVAPSASSEATKGSWGWLGLLPVAVE